MLKALGFISWPLFLSVSPESPQFFGFKYHLCACDFSIYIPAWTSLLNSRQVYSAAYVPFPQGCCIRRPCKTCIRQALLTMTSHPSGVSQRGSSSLCAVSPMLCPRCHRSSTQAGGAARLWNMADHSVRENRKLGRREGGLKTSACSLLTQSSPVVNPDSNEVGNIENICDQQHSLSDRSSRHLQCISALTGLPTHTCPSQASPSQ